MFLDFGPRRWRAALGQVAASPPTIAIFCNDPSLFSDTYRRYLERHFRKSLGFDGTPMRFLFRSRRAREVKAGDQ